VSTEAKEEEARKIKESKKREYFLKEGMKILREINTFLKMIIRYLNYKRKDIDGLIGVFLKVLVQF
jgi:uncharacterized membrane protein YkvA (DUF1232 family)